MNEQDLNFELRIPTRTEYLELIRDFVSKVAGKAGMGRELADELELAVDEACANVMLHAHHLDSSKQIRVLVGLQGTKLMVRVTDEGERFDPTRVPQPDLEQHLSEHRVGGLGIYLIRRLMDEVQYALDAEGRNELCMVKYLSGSREGSQ